MLITYKELRRRFGIVFSRQHIYRLQRAGKFPLRRKVGNLNIWTVEEIEQWIEGASEANSDFPVRGGSGVSDGRLAPHFHAFDTYTTTLRTYL